MVFLIHNVDVSFYLDYVYLSGSFSQKLYVHVCYFYLESNRLKDDVT